MGKILKAPWINVPCTNVKLVTALRYHEYGRPQTSRGKETNNRKSKAPKVAHVASPRTTNLSLHQKVVEHFAKQPDIATSTDVQRDKEKRAIIKRLRAMYHVALKYDSFSAFEDEVRLLHECDAFHDCPIGGEAASYESGNASYVHPLTLTCSSPSCNITPAVPRHTLSTHTRRSMRACQSLTYPS